MSYADVSSRDDLPPTALVTVGRTWMTIQDAFYESMTPEYDGKGSTSGRGEQERLENEALARKVATVLMGLAGQNLLPSKSTA
jgi:hypothetical protein